jgi:hypothetical protein
MPHAPKARIIVDVLEEHLEGLAFLWEQWKNQISGRGSSRSFGELQKRIVAHIRGVEVYGEAAIPLLNEYFNSEETGEVFAATSSLLHLNLHDLEQLSKVLSDMESPQLTGVCDALCQCHLDDDVNEMLAGLVKSDASAAVVNASFILAFHGKLDNKPDNLLQDEDPTVKAQAWRFMAMTG